MIGAGFRLAAPWLLPVAAVALLLFLWARRRAGPAALRYGSTALVQGLPASRALRLAPLVTGLRALALALAALALARPQMPVGETRLPTEGIDILLVVDLSGSMAAEDLDWENHRTRLDVAKRVVGEFVQGRENDRIGLLVFSKYAYTRCPLTLDYDTLGRFLEGVQLGMIEDGTAIGTALATAVARFQDSKAKSRVIVLLTDGRNNAGEIEPDTAAELAKSQGIKVHCIGVGTQGMAPIKVRTPFGEAYQRMPVDVDDETLTRVAEATGGKYFRAVDADTLRSIYGEIDRLERTELEVIRWFEYRELFPWLVVPAVLALLLERLLSATRFLRVP